MNRNTEESESAAASQVARVEALCRSYLMVMESGDLEALLSLFTEDATATPPISGKQPVRDFYAYVMRITSARSMRLMTIFIGSSYRPGLRCTSPIPARWEMANLLQSRVSIFLS